MSSDPRDPVLALATRIAREAGAIQRDRYETRIATATKSTAIDLVTEVDHACEQAIVGAIERERPDDAILAEEGRGADDAEREWRWVIDPLDGTVNYAHGYPRFCVSIGVERDGRSEVGVVYDPLLDELYHAVRGRGAWLGERALAVSSCDELGRALLATGFAYDVHTNPGEATAAFTRMLLAARGIRRDGSAALDLCYVAAGRLDAYWELALHPWDVCAGNLIVEEAGGRVSDREGGPAPASGSSVVASNARIHEQVLERIQSAG